MTSVGTYGGLPGIDVGWVAPTRRRLVNERVHRALQAGIVGNRRDGAESVVVSGGYEDDEDYGTMIIYTGHGGNNPATRQQVSDQSLSAPGNAALVTSALTGRPVRVVRGHNPRSPHAPTEGYRYDGLYRVDSWWSERGKSGYLICRYRLLSVVMENPALLTGATPNVKAEPVGAVEPTRVSVTIQRVVRSSSVGEFVKGVHDFTCQFCSTRLVIGDRGYAEAAHIRPLGRPHDGPDVPANVLCLCPNCHVLFENGALVIDVQLYVHGANGDKRPLRTLKRHVVDPLHLAYHLLIHQRHP